MRSSSPVVVAAIILYLSLVARDGSGAVLTILVPRDGARWV